MDKIQSHPREKRHNGYKTIRFPVDQTQYADFLHDRPYARTHLDKLLSEHPEIFPAEMIHGYAFNGFTEVSAKRGIRCRRIRLRASGEVFTLAPSFVLPYMRDWTEEVEKALFLLRFHVWAISYVFGQSAMYGWRLQCSLGHFSVVATTVTEPEKLPSDLVADEKHTPLGGERAYVAMTAAGECILGASVSPQASTPALARAYGVFAQEARALKADYRPETVNTDGWEPTRQAWRRLFPRVTVILCFLHAFIKIRDRATKTMQQAFAQVSERVWQAYRAQTKRQFARRLSDGGAPASSARVGRSGLGGFCDERACVGLVCQAGPVHREL